MSKANSTALAVCVIAFLGGCSGADGAGNSGSAQPSEETVDSVDQAATTCSVPSFITQSPTPTGWATQNGGTTGGGTAKATTVTTLAQLNSAAKGTTAAVIYVQGKLAQGTVTIGSNKTIIGCSGNNALNGHVELKGSSNVILRNLNVIGYNCAPPDVNTATGGQCQNGQDAMTIEKDSHHIWIDHSAISDGSDGNLDITHASDDITISYTKFFYSTKRSDPNDTGAAGHRFSDLIGHSDSNGSEDTGHLNITFHHDWWAQNVVERAPRIRFGKVHLYNDLWTNTGDDYCIGVGVGANVRSEENAFIGVKTPIDTTSYVNSSIAKSVAKSTSNLYSGTSGKSPADLNASSVFAPPYSFSAESASAVQADVQANAGPK
ncbi:MAG TPA: polysaccharide lyase family 1 protein [Polyangiaceae bacterium]|jgi:pectate lyase|nr:polysaccharide lyase family 1 protein [Polyangiaceae bacterium]